MRQAAFFAQSLEANSNKWFLHLDLSIFANFADLQIVLRKLLQFQLFIISSTSRYCEEMSCWQALGATMECSDIPTGATNCLFAEMIFPEHANHYGTLYGAKGLEMMGRAAFVAASRFARQPVVMAATDAVRFRKPVPIGSLLEFTAVVTRCGHASMTVLVEATMENLTSGRRHQAMTGRFEMVAVNEHGRPAPLQNNCHVEILEETHS
ncbi:hotdog domain-containing protein [Rhizobium sp. WW_1]|uniref:acyl-CoA thioesterase n=1 Tax=Rhizobium sp. WW_1 TaxID=1907375 RepID=UPI0032AF1FEC